MADDVGQADAREAAGEVSDLPDLLLDKVTFGFGVVVSGVPEGADRRVEVALREADLLRRSSGRGSAVTWEVRVPVGHGLALDASVACAVDPPILRVTAGSRLDLPALRLLRAHLVDEGEDVGGLAMDGAGNVIGPTADRAADLLRVQLGLVRGAVDAFTAVLAVAILYPALGHQADDALSRHVREERLWVRTLEVNRDYAVADAVAAVRALDKAPPPDVRRASRDVYDNGGVAVRWKRTGTDEVKAYAKRPDLLRLEAARRTRRDVAALTGAASEEIGGDEAVALLLNAAQLAEADLDWAEAHALQALVAPSDPGRLVVRLLPLVRLAAGEKPNPGARGPGPGQSTVAGAKRALSDLLTTGAPQPRPDGPARRAAAVVVRAGRAPCGAADALHGGGAAARGRGR
jgi:hypothetical protein